MSNDDSTQTPASTAAQPDFYLLKHIEGLGLTTLDEYVEWCARHGFSRRTDKDWRERLKERSHANRGVADARLQQTKLEHRKPLQVMERIFRGELAEHGITDPHLKAVCRAYETARACPETQHALLRLLRQAGKHGLVDSRPVIAQYARNDDNTYIGGMLAMARHWEKWLRPVEDWRPQSRNAGRQFSSLASHLFADWPVPTCLESVWFKGGAEEAQRQQRWFLHVGQGQSIRTADLPLPFTKKMAHHFNQAPPECTIEAALRWGQILGLGGNIRFVRTVLGTRLGRTFEHEDFWRTVLQFFIANPLLDRAQVGPIIDYLHQQRFVPQEDFVAPGVVGPPQPHLTLKGRAPESLLREVDEWHRRLAAARIPRVEWRSSGIEGLVLRDDSAGAPQIWTISELRTSTSLVSEGREMRHCVASYLRWCVHGFCSIWTLEVETVEGRAKLLTIEVRNETKMIVQAKGKRNKLPSQTHREILARWAERAGLTLSEHV